MEGTTVAPGAESLMRRGESQPVTHLGGVGESLMEGTTGDESFVAPGEPFGGAMNCEQRDLNFDCLPKGILEDILWRICDWSGPAASGNIPEKLPREIGEMSLVSREWREIACEHVRVIHVEPAATADALTGILGRYKNVTRVVLCEGSFSGSAHLLALLALHCPQLERLHFACEGVTNEGDCLSQAEPWIHYRCGTPEFRCRGDPRMWKRSFWRRWRLW
eukprot:TRINITY_DN4198_c0_g1_i3.p1 TRINITY_DN4198_c0_g1~~TRINITY_DN4198_c0_g1_i3.p1  ORF type:complete len:220 (-),score=6.12 TRINITY_DN4198_c0_g1_i3:253-912(-)